MLLIVTGGACNRLDYSDMWFFSDECNSVEDLCRCLMVRGMNANSKSTDDLPIQVPVGLEIEKVKQNCA